VGGKEIKWKKRGNEPAENESKSLTSHLKGVAEMNVKSRKVLSQRNEKCGIKKTQFSLYHNSR
jgi:hypothetical protein